MTLVVSSADDDSVVEIPTYRLVNTDSPFDRTQATLWFYSSRAKKIQATWRRHVAKRLFREQQEIVLAHRDARVRTYFERRMKELLQLIAWDGIPCHAAATTIQRWFRRCVRRASVHRDPDVEGAVLPVRLEGSQY